MPHFLWKKAEMSPKYLYTKSIMLTIKIILCHNTTMALWLFARSELGVTGGRVKLKIIIFYDEGNPQYQFSSISSNYKIRFYENVNHLPTLLIKYNNGTKRFLHTLSFCINPHQIEFWKILTLNWESGTVTKVFTGWL